MILAGECFLFASLGDPILESFSLLCCPKQMAKLVMKLYILNLSHFLSRSTSKNVFLGFEKWCRRWVVMGLDLKSVWGSNDFLFGC